MLKTILLASAAIAVCVNVTAAGAQNIEGQIIASQYGEWKVQGYSPDIYTFAPTSCRVQGGASFFPAFTVGTPIRIVDGSPGLSETVIPSSFLYNNTTCSISISPVNHHQLPFYLTSATAGLQEAINANVSNPGTNTIILNNQWYRLGGSPAVISSVKGTAQLGLIDITTIPSTWYQWNGSQYVQVALGSDVLSVFGRTGNVTAQAGDYTCDMVTNCWNAPNQGFLASLSTAISPTASTVTVFGASGNPGSEGYFFIDQEWMHYTAYNASTGVFTLGPDLFGCSGRGCLGDTAASHTTVGAQVLGASFLSAVGNTAPGLVMVGTVPSETASVGINQTHPNQGRIWFGQDFFDSSGGLHQVANTPSSFYGSLYVGTNNIFAPFFGFYPITNSTNIPQETVPSQMQSQLGLGAGVAGNVEATVPGTIPAATLTPEFMPSGPCSITYALTGADQDGNAVAGTNATVSNLEAFPWTFPTNVHIQGQKSAGVVAYHAYRVSTSGCGASTTGQWTGPVTGTDYPLFQDGGATADGTTPPSSTASVPKLCTNGEQFCILSGTSATPPVTCAVGTEGWEYHDVATSPAHHAYICESGAWTGVY